MASNLEQLDPTQPPIIDVPVRLNFDDLANDPKHRKERDLYLQALSALKQEGPTQLKGFYQIAGIHGLPYTDWDDTKKPGEGSPPQKKEQWEGYCTHGNVLFPTWHRPYVALYEKAILDHAEEIAKKFTDVDLQKEYLTAAAILRQPFYDWAAPGAKMPELLYDPKYARIEVRSPPLGQPELIDNPLFGFTYPKGVRDDTWILNGDPRFRVWNNTVRYPIKDSVPYNPDEPGQPKPFHEVIESHNKELGDLVYYLLHKIKDWRTMSNHTTAPDASLEGIHDLVHDLLGGNGHMSEPAVAGFDPIFWLHHANVDRLLAVWQALNANEWVVPGDSDEGTRTIPLGTTVTTDTNLTPFRVATGSDFWTSTQTRDFVKEFNYTYPESKSGTATADDIFVAVNELYNQNFKTELPQPAPEGFSAPLGLHLDKHYLDWAVKITLKLHEFPKSGYVHVFLAKTVPESGGWLLAPERVGDIGIFRNTSNLCENCNQHEEAGATISGIVLLTRALLERNLDINTPETVVEYLKENLAWRLALTDGTELPLARVPSLQVKITSEKVTRPAIPPRGPDVPDGDNRHRIPTRFPTRGVPTEHEGIGNH
ncbi:Di-copper centre-containing protein [Pluteus cervinus]|uniref:Di-copper centre-containing protein n=1 Tax=Pluteus cervinus TaxID=181527 RepID=A0ACD3AX98_9AGAR|nr:Di-copper centre-containing protein [Pluteus cervinus]